MQEVFFNAFIDELEKLAASRRIKLVAKDKVPPSSSYEVARAAAHKAGKESATRDRPSEVGKAARKASREFGEQSEAKKPQDEPKRPYTPGLHAGGIPESHTRSLLSRRPRAKGI